jgi:hypothetical protein
MGAAKLLDDCSERHWLGLGGEELEHVQAFFERGGAIARIVLLHLAPLAVHTPLLCITAAAEPIVTVYTVVSPVNMLFTDGECG